MNSLRERSLLIIAEDSPQSYSPAGERILHLALASRERFDQVVVLTLRQTGQLACARKSSDPRYRVFTLNFSRALPFPFSGFFDPVKVLMLLAYALLVGRKAKPSHVMVSMPPLESGLAAWIVAKIHRAYLVIDLRDDWESSVGTQLKRYFPAAVIETLSSVAKRLYSSATAVFAATQVIVTTTKSRGVETRILFVPNGANTTLFKLETKEIQTQIRTQFTLPQDRTIAIYCGSGINPYYRLDLVLQSVKRLPKTVAEKTFFVFYLYNGNKEINKLKQQLDISDSQVSIRDPLPRKKLARVIAACDIGFVPFDAKPYLKCARSTKLYEYLSCGLSVISSGPKGGELDSFFSSRPELGFFTLPSASNYVRIINEVIGQEETHLNYEARLTRHEFIRLNYDRQTLMKKALHALFSKKEPNNKEAH